MSAWKTSIARRSCKHCAQVALHSEQPWTFYGEDDSMGDSEGHRSLGHHRSANHDHAVEHYESERNPFSAENTRFSMCRATGVLKLAILVGIEPVANRNQSGHDMALRCRDGIDARFLVRTCIEAQSHVIASMASGDAQQTHLPVDKLKKLPGATSAAAGGAAADCGGAGPGGGVAGQAPRRPRPTRLPHPIPLPRPLRRPRHQSERLAAKLGSATACGITDGDTRACRPGMPRDIHSCS